TTSSFSRFASSAFIPPYCARHRWKVCSLTPRVCTICPIVLPVASIASASRSFAMICSGVCLVRFILESLLNPTGARRNSHSRWIRLWGAGQEEEVYWRLYENPGHARQCLAEFRDRYNELRPHWALQPEAGGDVVPPA